MTTTLEDIRAQLLTLGALARHILKNTVLDKSRQRTFRDRNNYRTELIQVAAVAIAAVTDLDMSQSMHGKLQSVVEVEILQDVLNERRRQDKKFNRSLPIALDPLLWVAVLVEEVAEVAEEIEVTPSESPKYKPHIYFTEEELTRYFGEVEEEKPTIDAEEIAINTVAMVAAKHVLVENPYLLIQYLQEAIDTQINNSTMGLNNELG